MTRTTGEKSGKLTIDRQYRLVDQALSMHATLRDGYERRAFWLNTSQIGVSLLLCVLAFVGDAIIETAGFDAQKLRLGLGAIATLVLLLSITEFRVDWKRRAAQHRDAVKRLGKLKGKYRSRGEVVANGEGGDSVSMLEDAYNETMGRLPPIPERLFGQLKGKHGFKVALSRRVSENPTAPTWFLRALLRWEGMRTAFKDRRK